MTKDQILQYAKFIAVGKGTLTKAMNDQLLGGDTRLAVSIMSERISDLQAMNVQGLGDNVTREDIDSMISSVRDAIAALGNETPDEDWTSS